MPIRPPTHRAAGQVRRTALVEAALEVIAEKGVGGATHRAIAAQAGMPLSTTSYFFASIDELIAEALRTVSARLIAQVEQLAEDLSRDRGSADDLIDRGVALLLAVRTEEIAAQFEIYLQCAYRPELHAIAHHVIASFEQTAETVLRAAGANQPREGARAVVALIDGFALNRLAWPRGDADRRALESGIRALVSAYLSDGERPSS